MSYRTSKTIEALDSDKEQRNENLGPVGTEQSVIVFDAAKGTKTQRTYTTTDRSVSIGPRFLLLWLSSRHDILYMIHDM